MKKIALLALILLFLPFSPAFGLSISSPNYQLEDPSIGIGSVDPTSPGGETTKIGSILGRTSAANFVRDGYLVYRGFGEIKSLAPFTFTVSNSNLTSGASNSTEPNTASVDLIVSFGSTPGYQVTAREDEALRTLNNNSIADTKCDKLTMCSFSAANVWTSSAVYGFGYNMRSQKQPNIVPADFIDPTYFRPFANRALDQNPTVVMSSSPFSLDSTTHQSTMTFKINFPATQPEGTYTTVIELTATPFY